MQAEWLGNACFRLTHPSGQSLLLDPWIEENPGCPYAIGDLKDLNWVLVTHGHPGHFGRHFDSPRVALTSGCPYIAPAALCEFVRAEYRRAGLPACPQLQPMHPGETRKLPGGPTITLFSVPHSPLNPDIPMGPAPGEPNCGFLIEWDDWCVLHVGDAVPDPVFARVTAGKRVDLAILAGWIPNMHAGREQTALELAEITRAVNPRFVFPHMRYDPANDSPGDLAQLLRREGHPAQLVFGPPGTVIPLGR